MKFTVGPQVQLDLTSGYFFLLLGRGTRLRAVRYAGSSLTMPRRTTWWMQTTESTWAPRMESVLSGLHF